MNYRWGLLLLCCCCLQPALAQTTDNPQQEIPYSGNPYLLKDWSNGVVRFSGGRVLTEPKLKFDCFKNQLLMQFKGSVFAAESKVIEFVLYTKNGKEKDSILMRKGYPAIGDANQETYYQVLVDGKATLLKLLIKRIVQEKQLVGSTVYSKLEDEDLFYLFKDGVITLLPKERGEVSKVFPDKADAVAQFINDKQLKMRNAADFVAVVKKYNEL